MSLRFQQNTKQKKRVQIQIRTLALQNRMHKSFPFFKSVYQSVIPCDIYQTWHTKLLPPKMQSRVDTLKSQNPRFRHFLFDDSDCRIFIQTHFHSDVLYAYDHLIPGAYKADLWRLCVLYIHGGIYLDIKLICINGFKLIELTERNHFVKDRFGLGMYNALMISQSGNVFLWKCIQTIVKNVKNRFYGQGPLEPTGPTLMKTVAFQNKYNVNLDLVHFVDGGYILYKNYFVFSTEYPEYDAERNESFQHLQTKRYDKLWHERTIYM